MVSARTLRRIGIELVALQSNPPDGVRVAVDEADLLAFSACIQGPPETPYASGYFSIAFSFTPEYPVVPPHCRITTPIFHPNVSRSGEICVSTLKKDWKPEYTLAHILMTIRCLLIAPNPDSALDPEASRLLQEHYDEYAETARLWTSVHASKPPAALSFPQPQPQPQPQPLAKSTAANCSQPQTGSNDQAKVAAPPASTAPSTGPQAKVKRLAAAAAPKRGIRRL